MALFTSLTILKSIQQFSPTPNLSHKSLTSSRTVSNSLLPHKNIFHQPNKFQGWNSHIPSFLWFTKGPPFLQGFHLHQNYPIKYMVPTTHFSKNMGYHSSKIINSTQFKFGPDSIFLIQTYFYLIQKFPNSAKLIFEHPHITTKIPTKS